MRDVAVVGAGTAGAYAAYLMARSGLSVLLIDSKPRERVGDKVCGDAIGAHHFEELGLSPPSGPEDEGTFPGVKVISPDEEHSFVVRGEGYAINRLAFGQRLLKMAEDAGAEFWGSTSALSPLVEGSSVVGVRVSRRGERVDVRARITVDATGASASLRTKLPESWWVSERPDPSDFNAAYREIIELDEPVDEVYACVYLNPEVAPGGYWWLFPKRGGEEVNLGIGVQVGRGNPRVNYERYVRPRVGGRAVHSGGGLVPTRRTVSCFVWNGFMAVGDVLPAANPIHGGGIGPSMLSARAAAQTAVEALETGSPSLENLWPYHRRYHEVYGAKQASLDVLRMYLQRMTPEDLNFIIGRGLVTGDEVDRIGRAGVVSPALVSRIVSAAVRRPFLMLKLKKMKEYMDRAAELYMRFPETPEDFPRWREEERSLFAEYSEWLGR